MTNEKLNSHSLELVEKIIARILAVGILFSSLFYVIGLILVFVKQSSVNANESSFKSPSDFFYGFVTLRPKTYLFMGTLVLIFTPISRVVLSIYLFYKKKESKFVLITVIVAVIIVVSVLMGILFSLKLG